MTEEELTPDEILQSKLSIENNYVKENMLIDEDPWEIILKSGKGLETLIPY